MSEMTLRVIEGLVLYDIFRIVLHLITRLILGATEGEKGDE